MNDPPVKVIPRKERGSERTGRDRNGTKNCHALVILLIDNFETLLSFLFAKCYLRLLRERNSDTKLRVEKSIIMLEMDEMDDVKIN